MLPETAIRRLESLGYRFTNPESLRAAIRRISQLPGVANDPETQTRITEILCEEFGHATINPADLSTGTQVERHNRGKAKVRKTTDLPDIASYE